MVAAAVASGEPEPAGPFAVRWRAALERPLLWAQADVAFLALGSAAATQHLQTTRRAREGRLAPGP
eukprot:6217194-Lingulodinium_polyedra.AAC.1